MKVGQKWTSLPRRRLPDRRVSATWIEGGAPFWNSEGSFIIHRPRGLLFEMKNYPVWVGGGTRKSHVLVWSNKNCNLLSDNSASHSELNSEKTPFFCLHAAFQNCWAVSRTDLKLDPTCLLLKVKQGSWPIWHQTSSQWKEQVLNRCLILHCSDDAISPDQKNQNSKALKIRP